MSLPPIQCGPWDHANIIDQLHYYETDEVLEYGRQCWNAAIEEVLPFVDSPSLRLIKIAIAARKINLNTVSTNE